MKSANESLKQRDSKACLTNQLCFFMFRHISCNMPPHLRPLGIKPRTRAAGKRWAYSWGSGCLQYSCLYHPSSAWSQRGWDHSLGESGEQSIEPKRISLKPQASQSLPWSLDSLVPITHLSFLNLPFGMNMSIGAYPTIVFGRVWLVWFQSSPLEDNLPWDEFHLKSHPFLTLDLMLEWVKIWGCWAVMSIFSCEKDINLGRPRAECYVYAPPKFMC